MEFTLEKEGLIVRIDKRKVCLTNLQFKLLKLLKSADGHLVTRRRIMREVWGWPHDVQGSLSTRTVDLHISRLRRKLNGRRMLIRTVRGRGYAYII